MDSVPATGIDLPAIGGEIAGKYRVESVLGQGGMGAVFAARNVLTGKRVAIKWLLPQLASPTSRERLLREARIAGEIEHPNVVDVYDVGEHEGGLFLVMELLRGRSLAEVLAVRGRLSPEELIPLLLPAMRGVHAAHAHGVVHRDLKPENIFLSELDGAIVPKVLDFGVSKSMDTLSEAPSQLTRTGALIGTPHYMAVEQVDGSSAVDQRTDVYGFGVLLYRALTGYFPFDGSSLGEVILKIGTTQPTAPRLLRPELPEALEVVMLCALSRARSDRFANLEAFAAALSPFMPPANTTLDGVPRYSVSAEPTSARALAAASGQRSIDSIVRDSGPNPGGRQFDSGTDKSRANTATRYPTAALWAAGLSVLAAVASVAAWASTRSPGPVEHTRPVPDMPSQGPARGGLIQAPGSVRPAASTPRGPVTNDTPDTASAALENAAANAPLGDADSAQAGADGGSADAVVAMPADDPPARKWHANPARVRASGRVIPGDRTKGLSSDDF